MSDEDEIAALKRTIAFFERATGDYPNLPGLRTALARLEGMATPDYSDEITAEQIAALNRIVPHEAFSDYKVVEGMAAPPPKRFGEPAPRKFTGERPGPGWPISEATQRELEAMERGRVAAPAPAKSVEGMAAPGGANDDLMDRAAQAYGFVAMPDPVTLFPRQFEIIHNIAAALTAAEDGALRHLGNALYTVSDLRLDYRSEALDDAQRFYNAARPDAIIEPSGYPDQRLITDCEIADIKAAAEDGARRATAIKAAHVVRAQQDSERPATYGEIAKAIMALATKATPEEGGTTE